jgi:HAMP domain-containing protein
VISAPDQGGMDWLLLAVVVAALAAAAAAVLVLRRSQLESGPAVGLPGWRLHRLRLSLLVGAMAALPLLTGRARRRSRAHDGEAAGALLEPPEPELAKIAPAPAEVEPPAAERNPASAEAEPPAADLIEPPAAPTAPGDASLAEAAAFALATTLEREHDLHGEQDAYRRADELGHPDAAFHLGGMLAEHGDLEAATALYCRADELGHAAGAFNLDE